MALDFSDMDRVTKEFIEDFYRKNGERIMGVKTYGTTDGIHFKEFGQWPRTDQMRNVTPPKPNQIEEKS